MTMEITQPEKEFIIHLNHPLYTVEFLEHWVNRNDNPMINAPAALQAMGAKGFLEAVRRIVALDVTGEQRSVGDTVEVVRCVNCIFVEQCRDGLTCMHDQGMVGNIHSDDFCSFGRR